MMCKPITILCMLFVLAVPVFCSDDAAEVRNQTRLFDESALQIGNEKTCQAMSTRLGIPVETIKAQKQETNLGLGNLFIANSLAKASGKEFSALVQEFQAGKGWGEIGKSYGVKLGPVVSQLKRSTQAAVQTRSRTGSEQKQTRERAGQTSRQSNHTQAGNAAGRSRR